MPEAYLIGVLLEGILFGLNTCLFCLCCLDLTIRRRTTGINWVLLGSATVMWIGCTIHVGIAIQRTVTAFIDSENIPGGPEAYLNEENTPLWLASESVFLFVNTVADLLLAYRCWIIWNYNYWIILGPMLSILGSMSAGFGALAGMGMLQPGQTIGLYTVVVSADALFGFSLCTNIITTALIAARITHLIRRNLAALPRGHKKQYISVVGIVVESGALMAVTQAIFLGLWSTQNVVLWTFYAMLAQVMGISPMLIIVRASAQAQNQDPALTVIAPITNKSTIVNRPPPPPGRGRGEPPFVLTEIETHRDTTRGTPFDGAEEYGKKGSDGSLGEEWEA